MAYVSQEHPRIAEWVNAQIISVAEAEEYKAVDHYVLATGWSPKHRAFRDMLAGPELQAYLKYSGKNISFSNISFETARDLVLQSRQDSEKTFRPVEMRKAAEDAAKDYLAERGMVVALQDGTWVAEKWDESFTPGKGTPSETQEIFIKEVTKYVGEQRQFVAKMSGKIKKKEGIRVITQ